MKHYPTKQHEKAARKFVEIFAEDSRVKTILLMCSCARGKAVKDSCLDMGLIIKDMKDYEKIKNKTEKLNKSVKEFKELSKAGKYSHIGVYIATGKIKPDKRDWTSGPDEFELEIGNVFKYSIVLLDKNNYFKKLSKKYLPYYNWSLRKKRLAEVKMFCLNNLNHIPLYAKRKLYFQAFDRLYKANQEFMQALFIKKKIYPISYTKWVKEQFVEILKMPELYKKIVNIIQIKKFESNETARKAKSLKKLVKKYIK